MNSSRFEFLYAMVCCILVIVIILSREAHEDNLLEVCASEWRPGLSVERNINAGQPDSLVGFVEKVSAYTKDSGCKLYVRWHEQNGNIFFEDVFSYELVRFNQKQATSLYKEYQ